MIATFAVVGHPNKGKSSIVATLAENEQVAIGDAPGTTFDADRYTFSIEGETLYVLIDTPGFQRSKEVLEWLHEREEGVSDRPRLVADFVAANDTDERFRDECTLLKPIVEGAGILYVVDGTKPYGAEFQIEMEILRWTGQPRMALVNMIGDGDYLAEWRHALGQYFSIVRVFDAMRADFDTRLNLLRAFGELAEPWRPSLDRAVAALQSERELRLQQSASEIADELIDCIQLKVRAPLRDHIATDEGLENTLEDLADDNRKALTTQLLNDLQQQLRRREQAARERVQAMYHHESLTRDEVGLALVGGDLFTRESWELFGLSKLQLVVTGSVSGAIAGFGIDAAVGGASLLLGTGIGAVVGGIGTWLGSSQLARTNVLGDPLGDRILEVGPVSRANFPWVLVGRAWLHHHLVRERNHALRDAISMRLDTAEHLMNQTPDELRRDLGKAFENLRDPDVGSDSRLALVNLVVSLLRLEPEAAPVSTAIADPQQS